MQRTTRSFADVLAAELDAARAPDGGFGMSVGSPSEAEPTAVAALALDDDRARAWLASAQRQDGGFAALDGRLESPTVSALAALALDRGDARRRALAHAVAERARAIGESGDEDGDGRDGWGWTSETYAWVEPTSRVLLATKVLSPHDSATRAEALALLRVRRCPDGGWNYGNASVKGVDLRGYAQTTAVALMALQGESARDTVRPLRFLEQRWRDEPGGLTLAQTAIAFHLHGHHSSAPVLAALEHAHRKTGYLGNVLALAWATLAAGPASRINRLRSSA